MPSVESAPLDTRACWKRKHAGSEDAWVIVRSELPAGTWVRVRRQHASSFGRAYGARVRVKRSQEWNDMRLNACDCDAVFSGAPRATACARTHKHGVRAGLVGPGVATCARGSFSPGSSEPSAFGSAQLL